MKGQVVQARRDLTDEFEKLGRSAKTQVTGIEQTPGLGQSNPQIADPNQFSNAEALWAQEQRKNDERVQQLRTMISQMKVDENEAKLKRQQQEQAWQKAQEEAMQAGKPKEEDKRGFTAIISKATKRIKGRLGQVGKGKMEKGRAAGG